MNAYDLAQFQQAIQLAQAGRKIQAYHRIKVLLPTNPDEVNLWFWLIFTTPDLVEAAQALDRITLLDPTNSGLSAARNWLQTELQKQNHSNSKPAFEQRPPPASTPSSSPPRASSDPIEAASQNNVFKPPVTL